jgi:hypothetical protein
MRSKLTEAWIQAIEDQKTSSWDEVRVSLHEFITYLDTELPIFSDGDAAKRQVSYYWQGNSRVTIPRSFI